MLSWHRMRIEVLVRRGENPKRGTFRQIQVKFNESSGKENVASLHRHVYVNAEWYIVNRFNYHRTRIFPS